MKVSSILASMLTVLSMTFAVTASAQTAIRVGGTPTSAPFTYLDTKTNQIDGLMVDIAKGVAQKAGLQLQFEPMAFSALIGSLTTNRIDLISAGMFITDARKQVVDFSQPVFSFGEGLIASKKDNTAYTGFADMSGKRIGVSIGTATVELVNKANEQYKFAEVKLYDSATELIADLNNGRIDLVALDLPISVQAEKSGNYPNIKVVRTYKPAKVGEVGLATRKGDTALLNKVNAAITQMKADGSLDAILKKWGII
jgi:polar amino acid transport system substrate-binding protein